MTDGKEEMQSGQKKGQSATPAEKAKRPSKPVDARAGTMVDTRAGTMIDTRQASKGKGGDSAGSEGRSRDGSR